MTARPFACSATKGAKSAWQALPLYVQVPSARKYANSLWRPCSNRLYHVPPPAPQSKTRPCCCPSASHSAKYVFPSVYVATPMHA